MLKHDDEVEGNHNFLHLHPLSLCKNFVKMHEKSSKHATKITHCTCEGTLPEKFCAKHMEGVF